MLARVLDLSVPIYEGTSVDDLGPKFWVRLELVGGTGAPVRALAFRG